MNRCRCRQGSHPGVWAAGALVAGLALAGLTQAPHGHHHGRHVQDGMLTSVQASAGNPGNLSTRASWARAFLRDIPEPLTRCNRNAVVAWETAEGGGFGNQAENNPLNINPGPGAPWPGYSATGAWAFPTTSDGLNYTVQTIRNGDYGGILAALSAGNNAQRVADAIENSPWAASHYGYALTATC
jgi:hypothetical protein